MPTKIVTPTNPQLLKRSLPVLARTAIGPTVSIAGTAAGLGEMLAVGDALGVGIEEGSGAAVSQILRKLQAASRKQAGIKAGYPGLA